MKFLERQTIGRQLAIAIGALLVPLIVAILWSASRTRSERQHEVYQTAASVASAAAVHLEQYIESLDAVASAALQHPSVIRLAPGCCSELFAQLLSSQPLLTTVVLTRPDGGLVAAAALPPTPAPPQISRAWIDKVTSTGLPVISELYKSQANGKPLVTLGYPVRSAEAAIVGALGLSVDLSRLQDVFAAVQLPAGSVITLLDGSGLVLARSVEAERYIGTTVSPPPADRDARPIFDDPDGVDRITARASVPRGRWTLTVGIPLTVVPRSLFPLWRRNVLIIGVYAFTLLALGLLVASETRLHVNRLRSAAEQIADGNLSPLARIPSPNREFSELQDAFIRMAGSLREARDALDRQVEQERRMNETLHSLERQVVRQERLAAVGVLVSGVAHELNNPLQAILGTAELLERQYGLSPAALEEIAFLKTQSGRAREIIRNLSRFSSQQSGPPTPVDLRDVVAEVVQMRRRDLDSSGVVLDVEMTSARKVHANFTELEQVTLNFVINAQQSIESSQTERGRIVVRVSDAGRRVRLEVLDNGAGVDPTDEPKLFQPFFTTKPVGKGTGLGLSVSYGIIDSYGGTIGHLRNEWGGATFFFELPAIDPGDVRHDPSAVLHKAV